jgi:DNA polymerase III subunit delta
MRLDIHRLPAHLHHALLPVYLVAGDEPLQRGEALDLIRAAARARGYGEREVLEQDAQLDWRQLAASGAALSLFCERRLIELRLGSPKIGNEGSAAIAAYLQPPPPDTVLLIAAPRLERTQGAGPKWVQAVERVGCLLQVWPVERGQLGAWLEQRMVGRGLAPEPGAAAWLAERVEGNLLAGAQEVEKLLLLQGPGSVTREQVQAAVSDGARYSVFDLGDSAVDGQAARSLRILRSLRGEGTASALALWALAKEVRLLAGLAAQAWEPGAVAQLLASRRDLRERRRPAYARALRRLAARDWQRLLVLCALVDRAIKGEDSADPWVLLEQLALGIARPPALDTPSRCP